MSYYSNLLYCTWNSAQHYVASWIGGELGGECCLSFTCVLSGFLQPHGSQNARFPCRSLSTRGCSNSCPLSWWCHPTISSSIAPFSSCPQSFPAQGSFPISRLFASGNQSVGASASVLPKNIQDWSPLGLTGLSSLLSKDIGGEWIHVCVYVWLSPFTVHLKLSQHCLLIGYTPVQI